MPAPPNPWSMADGVLANLQAETAAHAATKAELEASRQRNRGLVARVHDLEAALGQAQTLISGAMQSDPRVVHVGKAPCADVAWYEPFVAEANKDAAP